MLRSRFSVQAAMALIFAAGPALTLFAATPTEFFESEIRPLLAKHCFACHTQTKMGGLEMTSRDALLRGGASGPAIEPKAPERSLLIQAVRHEHERIKMPPTGKLSDEEIAKLAKWVDDGAAWPAGAEATKTTEGEFVITEDHRRFWAFQKVEKPQPPAADAVTAIDRFVLAKLEQEGLEPAPTADRPTLIRRLHFDLIGLPPTPEEVAAFVADDSPDAYPRLVDRLLASPRYGERWGRLWLDVARYSDDRLNSTQDEPFPNAFRYRDWVIRAFNEDLPYDLFVKAHLAADQLSPEELGGRSKEELVAALGFYGLSPKFQDDRIDATGKAFLGLTLGCAQCHDHKFDPIPTTDYYALLGVFNSTEVDERPLAPADVVKEYARHKKIADEAKAKLDKFLETQALALVDVLAAQTDDYLMAAWRVVGPEGAPVEQAAEEGGLDRETLERWVGYVGKTPRNHKLLDGWDELLTRDAGEDEVRAYAVHIEKLLLDVLDEKRRIDKENLIRLGGDESIRALARTELLGLERDRYFLWSDLASPDNRRLPVEADSGVLYYEDEALDRFLDGVWKEHVDRGRARVKELEAQVPDKYPFLHVVSDIEEPANEHVHIRGNRDNLGDEVPRRFLEILCDGEPEPFTHGSGRLDLARAIADPANPLTARVMANRIWLGHFGRGLVGTPSNFGMMGERPTHPELLDYLAARFVESGWSVKALHREILLSDAYRRSTTDLAQSREADPENKLLWRFNRQRLDVESLRDAALAIAGRLDTTAGGPPLKLTDDDNRRRTVYSFVSRRRLDDTLALFDFPNPNSHSERRIPTNTPLQGLYFLNSDFLMHESKALAERLADECSSQAERIARAYRLIYGREPDDEERALVERFLENDPEGWPRLAQVLLSSNEFLYVD